MKIDLKLIRAYAQNDCFATENGMVIDFAAEDCVICGMDLAERHRNPVGNVQGGAIFTLADFAFGIHCNLAMICGEDVGVTLGQSCSISYLKRTRGRRLIAKSTRLSKGRNTSVYRICVKDDLGIPIAEMLANAFTAAK